MIRLRPQLSFGLALWLACSVPSFAQGEFYIELRGPESSAPEQRASPASPAPAAQVPPAPTTATAPGRYGPIRSTDTLWAIAARHTRAPVTVQQTMVALYHLNPNAFVRGNVNYLQRGATLRLPTESQAQQRSPREAEAEFRRLSRQGNRSVTRAATAPRPEVTRQPAAASRPAPAAVPKPAEPARPATVLSEPKPAPAPAPVVASPPAATVSLTPSEPLVAAPVVAASAEPSTPEQAEQVALAQLQTRLMDELREQVAMSNEQLAALADNNQALRQRLSQLTAEVNELKLVRDGGRDLPGGTGSWFDELLRNPLNLALVLTLPALLLLALFTLWWRNRIRRELAEQERELAETTSAVMDEEHNDFDQLFATEPEPAGSPQASSFAEPEAKTTERDIDEDAFARFLEEQQLQEEQEAQLQLQEEREEQETQLQQGTEAQADEPEAVPEDLSQMLFDDETAMGGDRKNRVSNDDIDEMLFDSVAAETVEAPEEAESPQREKAAESYVSVDKLMEEAELSEGPERDYERKLDLELDEYADVLGRGQQVDIDLDEGGMGAKLDLARAYIEIEDIDSARELLNEALEQGNAEQQADARKLLQRLAKR
ncbi:FimV/HubP family polar landmark protein [Zobellella sp. An-6]|uniref:FimV/HubP family polar landmark protein n=1 Tax=Zobellella sp. An-6 TaxID=3400218 RepID=UPI004042F5FB